MLKKLIVLFVLLFSFSVVSAASNMTQTKSVTVDDIYVPLTGEPNPYISGKVTISNYKQSYESSGIFVYEDDGGDKATLPFELNTNVSNPIYLDPSKIVGAFTGVLDDTSSNGTDWLNASEWDEVGDVTAGTITVIKEGGVDKIRVSYGGNSSVAKSYSARLNFTDFSTDITKLRFIIGFEITDLPDKSPSSFISISLFNFGSSKEKRYKVQVSKDINYSGSIQGNKTGTFFLDDLINFSSSDEASFIKISIYDANSTVADPGEIKIYALALQKREFSFGIDNNSKTITNMYQTDNGYMRLSTLDFSFDYDAIAELGPIYFRAPASKFNAKYSNVSEVDYTSGNYANKIYYNFSMNVPKGIDLSYTDLTLKDKLGINSQQYDFVSVDNTVKTSQYSNSRKGKTLELLSGLNPGTKYLMEMELLYTQEQWEDMSEQVGALYGSSDSWWNRWWLWLVTLLGIRYGTKRIRRKGGI